MDIHRQSVYMDIPHQIHNFLIHTGHSQNICFIHAGIVYVFPVSKTYGYLFPFLGHVQCRIRIERTVLIQQCAKNGKTFFIRYLPMQLSFQFRQFQLLLLHIYGTLLYRLVQFQQQRIRPAAVCSMKAAHTDGAKTQEYDYIFHPAFRLVKGNTF